MAVDWVAQVKDKPGPDPLAETANRIAENPEGSWWYDMAVAQRLQRLAYIIDIVARNDEYDNEHLSNLIEQALLHHFVLLNPKIFKNNSNHGFFQALNILAAVRRLPELDHCGLLQFSAENRFREVMDRQFDAEAYHKEHSAGYHYMVAVTLINAVRSQVLSRANEEHQVGNIETNLSWMIKPSGFIAEFGDTDPRRITDAAKDKFFSDPSLSAVISKSIMAPSGVSQHIESGYAFARIHAPGIEPTFENFSYLAQMAAFHSRTHKHADHLGFIWHDRKRDILIDPGRYAYAGKTEVGSDLFNEGFWYSDPKRISRKRIRKHRHYWRISQNARFLGRGSPRRWYQGRSDSSCRGETAFV